MVGDSVIRHIFTLDMGFGAYGSTPLQEWATNGKTKLNYHISSFEYNNYRVWFTFYGKLVVSRGKLVRKISLRHTWEDFMREREEGLRHDDPPFANDDTPDSVFFGPGYHATTFTAEQFGDGLDTILNQW